MKRPFSVFLCLFIMFSFILIVGCSKDDKNLETIDSAVDEVKTAFETLYAKRKNQDPDYNAKNEILIKNTRIIYIKEDSDIEEFENIQYIVEFVIFSDYYGTNGKYFIDAGIYDSVIVFKDTTKECPFGSLIRRYSIAKYDYSCSFIDKVIDLEAAYNQIIKLNIA